HISKIAWTNFAVFLNAFISFALLSPNMSKTDFTKMNEFQYSLLDAGLINWYAALIPIAVLLFLSSKKVPAFLALTAGSITAIIISLFTNPQGFGSILSTLFGGYVSETC